MILTPDSLAGTPVRDIDQATYEALKTAWPAAYQAVTALQQRIDAGEQHPATSDWDVSLATLVMEAI